MSLFLKQLVSYSKSIDNRLLLCGISRHGTPRHGTPRHGTPRFDIARHGIATHGISGAQFGFAALAIGLGTILGSWRPVCANEVDSIAHPANSVVNPSDRVSNFSPKSDAISLNCEVVELTGRDARRQLIATVYSDQGSQRDITRDAIWSVQPAVLATIKTDGLLIPQESGEGHIKVEFEGKTSSIPIRVNLPDQEPLINFSNQIVPVFTKLGCNGGGCHGKISGQNGFRLSLLGFEPQEDYEYLVREGRGRRLFPAAPDSSLLLQKSVGTVPHGGGKRMEIDSDDYRTLRRWVAQAMPFGDPNDRKVESIEVVPAASRLIRGGAQQLSVIATFVDGRKEDITRTVQYESNNSDMADVSSTGVVQLRDLAGEVSVMARYQGKVGVFRASIPLDNTDAQWPEPANSVDQAVLAKLKSLKIPASEKANDLEFLRRVTLDIAGRLPTPHEQEMASKLSRFEIIDQLLETDDYAYHFASKWSAILRNRHVSAGTQFGVFAFHNWLVDSIQENLPYDQFVEQLLTASGSAQNDPSVIWYRQVSNTEARIEDLSQLFLGQRLQCARCHHHPFEKWGQQDYAQMAAFFSKVESRPGALPEEARFVSRVGEPLKAHPKTGQQLPPAGLEASEIKLASTEDPRASFANWMTNPENPFFAKSVANRYWKHFFGKGLVEPEDDLRVTNPPSNPELMDALAKEITDSGYDLKHLIRIICNSETYQRSSQANDWNLSDRNCFSRYYPKRQSAEVLLDSIDQVLGTKSSYAGLPAGTRALELPSTSFASYFLTVFGRPDSSTACECERTTESNLAQSLHLMNSNEIHEKLSSTENRLTAWAKSLEDANSQADVTAFDSQLKSIVHEIYLRSYTRLPRPQEESEAMAYLAERRDRIREGLEDFAWGILNSKEFLFNH